MRPIDETGVAAFLVADDSELELSQEAGTAQIDWLREEWSRHFGNLPPGTQTWWYEELKDPVLGYRKGVVAVRGCRVLADLVVLEDN